MGSWVGNYKNLTEAARFYFIYSRPESLGEEQKKGIYSVSLPVFSLFPPLFRPLPLLCLSVYLPARHFSLRRFGSRDALSQNF